MIPYTELAAALERWRIRQGLPVSATPIASAPSVAAVLTPPRPAPPSPPPAVVVRTAPPPPPSAPPPSAPPAVVAASAVPPPPSAQTLDEVDELLEPADEYDNEGNDFSMTFGGPPAAASGSIGGSIEGTIGGSVGDDVDESTHIGAAATSADDAFAAVPTTAAAPPTAWPEAREWPAEATAATAYGWGSSHRPPGQPGQPGDDDSTIVGGGKKR